MLLRSQTNFQCSFFLNLGQTEQGLSIPESGPNVTSIPVAPPPATEEPSMPIVYWSENFEPQPPPSEVENGYLLSIYLLLLYN